VPSSSKSNKRRCISCCAFVLAVCYATAPAAHDFWVEPNEYWLSPRAWTAISLQVGHGPFRQRSPIVMQRITRFAAVEPNGAIIDLRGDLRLGGATKDGDLCLRSPGTYVLVLETDDRAESYLPALRFNDYLKEEGLLPALERRTRLRRMDFDGSENYSRRAKSIVQVGPPQAGLQAQVTRPLGLPLEIVPERSPYSQPRPSVLPVSVIYQGHPLPGALVKLTNLEEDSVPFETHWTDRAGRAEFTMPAGGKWLLNVIWTRPQPSSRDTDFETIFSSLSFGFPSRVGQPGGASVRAAGVAQRSCTER
jgi:uncharacterized GH25 family protein